MTGIGRYRSQTATEPVVVNCNDGVSDERTSSGRLRSTFGPVAGRDERPTEDGSGATEIKTHNATTFYANPDERAAVLERLAKDGAISNFPMTFRRKDGRELPVLVDMIRLEERGEVSIDGLFLDLSDAAAKWA